MQSRPRRGFTRAAHASLGTRAAGGVARRQPVPGAVVAKAAPAHRLLTSQTLGPGSPLTSVSGALIGER